MTAKEYLNQYADAVKASERLRAEYVQEVEAIDSIRSPLGGDGTPHGSGISKTVENRAIKLADKALAWKSAELDALRIRQEIFEVVNSIPGEKGDVLYHRYICLEGMEQVAEAVGYSVRQAYNIHDAALDMVKDCIELQKDM